MFYWQEVRYACRLLAKSPAFSLLTVVVLAGGLAVSIFTFSFLHTAMLKPLPLPEGGRVVRLMTIGPAGETGYFGAVELARMRPRITCVRSCRRAARGEGTDGKAA